MVAACCMTTGRQPGFNDGPQVQPNRGTARLTAVEDVPLCDNFSYAFRFYSFWVIQHVGLVGISRVPRSRMVPRRHQVPATPEVIPAANRVLLGK
jgi:hypothetical protein